MDGWRMVHSAQLVAALSYLAMAMASAGMPLF